MDKQYTYAAVVGVLIIGSGLGAYAYLGGSASPIALVTGGQKVEIKPTDMVHGAANAPVTIIEYAFMTCPRRFQRTSSPS
jgi:hypothetical protein